MWEAGHGRGPASKGSAQGRRAGRRAAMVYDRAITVFSPDGHLFQAGPHPIDSCARVLCAAVRAAAASPWIGHLRPPPRALPQSCVWSILRVVYILRSPTQRGRWCSAGCAPPAHPPTLTHPSPPLPPPHPHPSPCHPTQWVECVLQEVPRHPTPHPPSSAPHLTPYPLPSGPNARPPTHTPPCRRWRMRWRRSATARWRWECEAPT